MKTHFLLFYQTFVLLWVFIFFQIKLFLNKGVKLLDTSVSQPGWYTARPPDGMTSFAVRTHMFTSMAALRSYWSDLKCVCLNTPLGKWKRY